jgi:colicin import membrane protein
MVPGTELHFHTRNPTNMLEQNLTPEILAAALQGLEAQRAQVESHIAEVKRMLGGRAQPATAPAEAPKPKRKMSAAGRRRMAEAAKKRWAEHRRKAEAAAKAKEPAAAAKAPRSRRKMSAAGRKRIADATRKRWAQYRRKKAEAAKAKGRAAVRKTAPRRAAKPALATGSPAE